MNAYPRVSLPRGQLVSFRPKRTTHRVESHGVYAFVGPPESGKTLLAVYLSRRHLHWPGPCICGDPQCDMGWTVFTNSESTWKGHAENGWAQPVDLIGQLLERDQDLSHALIILDEGYKYADSRRSMRKSNLEMGYFVSQRRKVGRGATKLYITAQSFDMLDRRLKQQTTRVYNCWTPNRGTTVHALVYNLAMGHLPPWARHRRPRHKWWPTEPAKRYYDTYENIQDDPELLERGAEPTVFVKTDEGMEALGLSAIIAARVQEAVAQGIAEIVPAELAETINARYRLSINARHVRGWLAGQGFPYTYRDDGTMSYTVLVDLTT